MLKALAATNIAVAGLNPANFVVADPVSTAPHGFDFTATVTAVFASLVINDPTNASWAFTITPAGGFLVGDVLHFSSDPKNKQLYVVRAGVNVYLADVILAGSMWPILFPGNNSFAFSNPTKLTINAISHYPTYWGV